MIDWVTNLVEQLGYGGIVLLMFVELVFPPIPSEFVLPFAGFAASQGSLVPALVIAAGVFGSVLGGILIYLLGRMIRDEQMERFIRRYGRRIGLRMDDLRKTEAWFDRHGTRAVLFGRMVPGIRSVISLPAGMRKMKFVPFFLSSLLGSTVWTIVLVGAGYILGDQYKKVGDFLGPVTSVVIVVVLVAVTIFVWRRVSMLKNVPEDSPRN